MIEQQEQSEEVEQGQDGEGSGGKRGKRGIDRVVVELTGVADPGESSEGAKSQGLTDMHYK